MESKYSGYFMLAVYFGGVAALEALIEKMTKKKVKDAGKTGGFLDDEIQSEAEDWEDHAEKKKEEDEKEEDRYQQFKREAEKRWASKP